MIKSYFPLFKKNININLFIALLCFCSCSEANKEKKTIDKSISNSSEKLNVLFIIADDLNCDLGSTEI